MKGINSQTTKLMAAARRFAALYSDGSLGVEAGYGDLETARQRLLGSSADDDTEIVEVEIRIVQSHGKPKIQAVTEHSAVCPLCHTEVFVEVPNVQA